MNYNLVPYSEFEALLKRVEFLENEIGRLKLFIDGKAVSRERAMQILNCGKDTLLRLTKSGEVVFSQNTPKGKILYNTESLYKYLDSNMIGKHKAKRNK